MPNKSIDRLVQVAKILRDPRYIELLKENRELKLQLFWKDHNLIKLRDLMVYANQKLLGPKCNCMDCTMSNRKSEDENMWVNGDDEPCLFKLYFEGLLSECGMTFAHKEPAPGYDLRPAWVEETSPDVDAHFVYNHEPDWVFFTYGGKIANAICVEDPELQKLDA